MDPDRAGYAVVPFSRFEQSGVDWLELSRRRHTIHGLLEVDVTEARRAIREYRAATGGTLSFTAFIVASLARAVAEDRRMHAYRLGRGRLVLFDDVDVAIAVEREIEGDKAPVGFSVRAADRRTVAEIHRDIQHAQNEAAPWSKAVRWLPLWLLLPAFIRRFLWAWFLSNPWRRKRLSGTVVVTAIGMFGGRSGWGIPLTDYSLCLTVGGVARKPWVVRERGAGQSERIEIREVLSLTISMDHDVINGAPAARFAKRLTELIESGTVLRELDSSVTPASGTRPMLPASPRRRV